MGLSRINNALAPMSGSLPLPVSPAPWDLIPSSGFCSHVHTFVHTEKKKKTCASQGGEKPICQNLARTHNPVLPPTDTDGTLRSTVGNSLPAHSIQGDLLT